MALWFIAAFAAYFVKGLCGFANTLVFTSIMGFSAANVDISPVDLLMGCPSNFIMTWRGRKWLNWRIVLPLSALVLLGSIPGAALLKMVDVERIKVVFGIVVTGVGMEMFIRETRGRQGKRSRALTTIVGLFSGLLCGLFGVGALLAACVGRETEDPDAFKANLNAVFLIENTCRIVSYTALGILSMASVRQVLMLLPFELAGLYAGMCSAAFLSAAAVRRLIILFLIVSGIVLAVSNLRIV
ncbi:MAG: sulfite exporter TauE/SafE family protein [Clostridia bacterium]|nr:sulfite exporter TauE/SafE family protein [Clostridia bacterium]